MGWVKIQPILNLFYQISQIPHPSGQTSTLRDFLIEFLKKCHCAIKTDSAGNIHAIKGKPTLIFQAHYDMVLVGQKIVPFIENGILKSRDSSLGADNGIAIALLLHFAKTRENMEILLTNDEEIGMIGANNITLQTHSKTMINLDSECINEICVGCAGGFDADIALDSPLRDFAMPNQSNPKNITFYKLTAQNFKGGHSGIDIDKNIPNAIVELLWTLESLREMCEFEIVEICGGEARNSIPINASAVIAVNKAIKLNPCDSTLETYPLRGAKNREQGRSSASADFLLEAEKRGSPPKSEKAPAFWRVCGAGLGVQPFLRKESSESNGKNGESTQGLHNVDSSLVALAQNDKSSVDCFDSQSESYNDEGRTDSPKQSTPHIALKKLTNFTPKSPLPSDIIPHLLRLHNGIYEMQGDSVTSSLNFSLISNECLKIMVRANSTEFLRRHKSRLKSLFGANIAFSGFYNAWECESSGDSPILSQLQKIYTKHKIPYKIVQIHAGLECGILKEKCALNEVVSIGPTILHPHSKNESLSLDSVGQIYDILCDLMPT